MAFAYVHRTKFGTFAITPYEGRWLVIYRNDSLGSYHSPEAALDDLVGGHTFTPSNGVDTSRVGLSDDLGEWERQPI